MKPIERPLGYGAVRRLRGANVEIAVGICLLAFSAYMILCNGFDWDVFLSFSEVDRRSWVLDHRAPLWSYQLCGGVTRIGDPQAFGLSPLFLVVILFGSFWGTKLALLVSAAAGMYFMTRLLALFGDIDARAGVPRAQCLTLAALFITSNFFLWHLLVGHFTFVSFFFGLGIIFYTLEGYLHGLGRKDLLLAILVAWQHYSGGFFHSTVYLLVPFFIAFGLFAAAAAAPGIRSATLQGRSHLRRMADATTFHVCGLLLASYKLIAVWQQQQENPRVLVAPYEFNDLGALFAYQLMPTRGSEWLFPLVRHTRWDLHEYSAFSLFPIALLLLCVRLASSRIRARGEGLVVRRAAPPAHGARRAVWPGLFEPGTGELLEIRAVSPAQRLSLPGLGAGRRPIRRGRDAQPRHGLRAAGRKERGPGTEPEILSVAAVALAREPLDIFLDGEPAAHPPTRFASR